MEDEPGRLGAEVRPRDQRRMGACATGHPGHVRGQRVRLDRTSRRKCPIGERVCDLEVSTLAAFDAREVLAWLVANGAISLPQHPPQPLDRVQEPADERGHVQQRDNAQRGED